MSGLDSDPPSSHHVKTLTHYTVCCQLNKPSRAATYQPQCIQAVTPMSQFHCGANKYLPNIWFILCSRPAKYAAIPPQVVGGYPPFYTILSVLLL